jgi:hypothetical protein
LNTPKHIPQRTCVGCRATTAKREFVRIVRTPDATVQVDETGKLSGRGAYLCANHSCWDEALKKDRLARALRTTISSADRDQLLSYAERFEPATAAVGG